MATNDRDFAVKVPATPDPTTGEQRQVYVTVYWQDRAASRGFRYGVYFQTITKDGYEQTNVFGAGGMSNSRLVARATRFSSKDFQQHCTTVTSRAAQAAEIMMTATPAAALYYLCTGQIPATDPARTTAEAVRS